MSKTFVCLLVLALLKPNFSQSECQQGISAWTLEQGDCFDDSYYSSYSKCTRCGFHVGKTKGFCYCENGQLDCESGCLSCGPNRHCNIFKATWFDLYFSLVTFATFLSCCCFFKRMRKSYVDDIPEASLRFEPYKYYQPKNKLHVTWTAKREVHTSGEIYTTHNYAYSGSNYVPVPNVQGSISSEAIIVGYSVRIIYDGDVDIGDRNIRLEDIPNYLTKGSVKSEVTSQTGISRSGGCLRDTEYSNCGMDSLLSLSVLGCLCWIYYPLYAEKRAKRKKVYESKLDYVANEKNNRHLSHLLEEADKVVSARVETAHKKEARLLNMTNNQVNNMGGGSGNNIQNGQIVLTYEQLQLLMLNAQAGNVANLPGMSQNQMNYAPGLENNQPNPIYPPEDLL